MKGINKIFKKLLCITSFSLAFLGAQSIECYAKGLIDLNTDLGIKSSISTISSNITPDSNTEVISSTETSNYTNVLTTGIYQEDNSSLIYSDGWGLASSINYDDGFIKIAKVPGASVTFTFSGTSFEIYGLKCKTYGTATVNIDGTDIAIIDSYNNLTLYNTLLYSSGKLSDGIHNVTITSNTTINPASTSTDFAIDKISINDNNTILSSGTYENDDEALSYTGNWGYVESNNYSNGSINVAKTPGSTLRFTFSGTSFELYGLKCKTYGTATINIDGTDVATVDAYNASTVYNALLYKSDTLASGTHYVTITSNTTMNPASTSTDFPIDKLVIHDARILTTGIYEDDNCYLDYSNGWASVKSDNYSNSSIQVSKVPGSTLKFTFSGTSFKLYGIKSPMNGVAIVNIDGTDVATVDAYNKYTLYNTLLYASNNLSDGVHNVVLTSCKDKNINSSSTDFSIDRITINDTNTILSTGIYDEDNDALIYSGTWSKVESPNYNAGSINVAKVPGSTLTFTFSGNEFELYGIKSPMNGMATINIDGVNVATIDAYNKYTLYNSLLYSTKNLSDGVHTVIVTNSEVKNSESSSTDFSIDKITINDTNTILSTGIYDEDNDALIYSGTWNTINSTNYNNGSMKIAKVPGSTLRFTFSGTSFELYGLKCKMYGTATINIDGNDIGTIDSYNPSTIANTLLYKSNTLSNGIHTVTLTTNSYINPNSTSSDFSIDKIAIYTSDKVLTTGVYEDTCDSINYSDNWIPVTSTSYTDSHVTLTKNIGSTVSFTFSGTSFRIYGNKCNMYGMANINIDGVDVATIDAYSPHSLYNELLFKSNILNDCIHCVTITSIEEKNANSTANDFAIDKIFINEPLPILEAGYYEDTNESLIYSGQWVPYYSTNYTNGSIMLAKASDSSVEFTFKGTSIDIYGIKYSMYGIIKVNIDGIEVDSIDTFSDPTVYTTLLHSSKNLSDGLHTVTITITDDKNSSATSTDFALDKIIIQ